MPAKIAEHPRLHQFLMLRNHWLVSTSLGMFGAPSAKPLKLWSSSDFVLHLQRRLVKTKVPKSTTTKVTVSKAGKRRFTGTRDLKLSQGYPERFGRQVAQNNSDICMFFL